MDKREYKVSVIIPTYKPDEKFRKLIRKLEFQTYPVEQILIMNTEEACFPKDAIKNMANVRVEHLTRAEFDHGGTRDRAAALVMGDLLLFMTQDAVPENDHLVEELVREFQNPDVWAAYARQLPDKDCDFIECYTRGFNYPGKSCVKSKEDLEKYGIKTFFCSNVCAMYRKENYHRLGGFEKRTIFNEDMIFAGKIIQNGGKIAYAANARVVHSHNYGCMEQLHRNFDLAVSQAEHPEIFQMAKSEKEGIRLVVSTASYLMKCKKVWLIPGLVIKSGFKYMGYYLGKRYQKLPKRLVKWLSMNKSYWS